MENECKEKLQRDLMRIPALMRTLEPEITGNIESKHGKMQGNAI